MNFVIRNETLSTESQLLFVIISVIITILGGLLCIVKHLNTLKKRQTKFEN